VKLRRDVRLEHRPAIVLEIAVFRHDLGVIVERASGSVQVVETTHHVSLARVEGLGGKIHISSKVGLGTTVDIQLPIDTDSLQKEAAWMASA